MIISEKQILSYIPIDIVKNNQVSFEVRDLGLIINADNWPSNLIYNPDLLQSDDMFYEQFCSDTTLWFYIESAIHRCKSLVSRATHESDIIWEHGPIRILEIGGECPKPWMTRTRVEVAIRKMINE